MAFQNDEKNKNKIKKLKKKKGVKKVFESLKIGGWTRPVIKRRPIGRWRPSTLQWVSTSSCEVRGQRFAIISPLFIRGESESLKSILGVFVSIRQFRFINQSITTGQFMIGLPFI